MSEYNFERTEEILDAIQSVNTRHVNDYITFGAEVFYDDPEIIEEDTSGIEEAVKNFDAAAATPYETFFNDLSLDPSIGEGLNAIKGNSYCNFITYEHDYYKVRLLIMEKLSTGFKALIDAVFAACVEIVERAKAVEEQMKEYWESVENLYVDWVENRGKYYSDPKDLDAFGDTGTAWEEQGIYWPERDVPGYTGDMDQRRRRFFLANIGNWTGTAGIDLVRPSAAAILSEIGDVIQEAMGKISEVKKLIQKWIDFGHEVLTEVSFVIHVFAFKSSLLEPNGEQFYHKLQEERETVGKYSERIVKAIEIVDTVEKNNPLANVAEKTREIKNIVFQQMDVKAKSNEIYDSIASYIGSTV